MEITQDDLELLLRIIIKNLREEFEIKHMSGNLINTIEIVKEKDSIKLIIPAQKYNMAKFQRDGVVVYNNRGSYASSLDEKGSEFFIYPGQTKSGSFLVKPHNHIGYIETVLNKSLQEWSSTKSVIITSKNG